MNSLGLLYERGAGVKQDYDKAAKLYKSAIGLGNKRAKSNLSRVETKLKSGSSSN